MKRYAGTERRKGFRKSLDFGLDIVQVNEVALKRKWDDEVGVNIGLDGFCCCSTKPLPDDAQATCMLLFPPPHDLRIVEAKATLVWQRQPNTRGERLWYHGFEFTKLNPPHRKLLEEILKNEAAPELLGAK